MEPAVQNLNELAPTSEQSSRVFELSGMPVVSSLVSSKTTEPPKMTLDTEVALKAAVRSMRRKLGARMVPVAIIDGKIRVQERAMVVLHPYDVRIGDSIFQFVKRTDGTVAMFEVAQNG